jgi:hypothetical protein
VATLVEQELASSVLCYSSSLLLGEQSQWSSFFRLADSLLLWGGFRAATRAASRRARGRRRRTRSCCSTSRRTAMAAGGPFRGLPVRTVLMEILNPLLAHTHTHHQPLHCSCKRSEDDHIVVHFLR